MSNRQRKSLFAFFSLVVGAALMTGAVPAQTPEPEPDAASAPVAKPRNTVTPSIIVLVANARSVAVTKLEVTPAGGIPKVIVANLAPGKKTSVSVTTAKSCVFAVHAAYADGASAELQSVDLCKDKTLNLREPSSSTPRGLDYYYRAAKRECAIEVAQSNLPPDVLHVQGGNGPIEQCLRGRGFDPSGNPIPTAYAGPRGTSGQAASSGSPATR